MAELKKFLFDNFVVGRGDTKMPEPLPEITASEEEKEEEIPEEEVVVESVEPEVVEEEKYSREELEEQKVASEQMGYERGKADASESQTVENNKLLMDISQKLTVLLAQAEENNEIREQKMMQVIKQALQKLVPTLLEENAVALVDKFLRENFNNFKQNEKLSFYIHPDIISYIQDSIVKLANNNDFEGKIAIHKDSSLEKSSCRVEWNDGGVEYAPETQLAQVEQILDKQ